MEKDEQELSQISSVGICQIIQISAGLRPGAKKIPVYSSPHTIRSLPSPLTLKIYI